MSVNIRLSSESVKLSPIPLAGHSNFVSGWHKAALLAHKMLEPPSLIPLDLLGDKTFYLSWSCSILLHFPNK